MKMETYPATANAVFKEFRHSRMLLAGIQGRELDPRLRHSGVTSWESSFLDSYPQIFEGGGHKVGRIRIAKFYSSFVSFVRFVVICYLLVDLATQNRRAAKFAQAAKL
jgi:hypothetical protein